MIELLIGGASVVYAFFAGVTFDLFDEQIDEYEPKIGTAILSLVWPLSLPSIMGWNASKTIRRHLVGRRERALLPEAKIHNR